MPPTVCKPATPVSPSRYGPLRNRRSEPCRTALGTDAAGSGLAGKPPREHAGRRAPRSVISDNDGVASKGKRAGSRRGTKKAPTWRPRLLGLAGCVTLAVVAWGYLVYAAIDFGASARGGDTEGWWLLALASMGAVACLFVALMLIARLLRELGITSDPNTPDSALPAPHPAQPEHTAAPRATAPGGRRAAR